MPEEFRRFGESWKDLNPGWELREWDESTLRPLLKNGAAFDDAPFLSSKADIGRYEIILRYGGLYVDCDIEPLKPIGTLFDGCSLIVCEEEPELFNNALFGADPGHPILRYAVDKVSESHFSRPKASTPDRTGPNFWTRSVLRGAAITGTEFCSLSRAMVYPYSHTQPHLRSASFPDSFAVHHWAKSWHPSAPSSSTARLATAKVRAKASRGLVRMKHVTETLEGRVRRIEPKRYRVNSSYVGDGRIVVTLRNGLVVYTFADDLGITPSLLADGAYDEPYLRYLRRELNRGDVAVDVGANIGLFTLEMAAAVGRTGIVMAYEPNPAVYELLTMSVYANRMRGLLCDVRAIQAAASSAEGARRLNVPRRHAGMASLVTSPVVPGGNIVEEVSTRSLDDDLAAVPEIALVKIDTEGHEAEVLIGLRRTIAEGRVLRIDLELQSRHAGNKWQELEDELRSIAAAYRPRSYTIASDGTPVDCSIPAALNSDGFQHFVLDFRV